MCSVAFQDYPPEKVAIYVYDDASTDNMLSSVCSQDTIMNFDSQGFSGGSSANLDDSTFDAVARELVAKLVPRISYKSVTCICSNEHLEHGGAKCWAFQPVSAKAEPNDVIVVVDGDDELYMTTALQTINQVYIDTS